VHDHIICGLWQILHREEAEGMIVTVGDLDPTPVGQTTHARREKAVHSRRWYCRSTDGHVGSMGFNRRFKRRHGALVSGDDVDVEVKARAHVWE
jgi:hypothetical protein